MISKPDYSSIIKITISLLCIGMIFCNSLIYPLSPASSSVLNPTPTLPKIPRPFQYLKEIPEGQFLFVFQENNFSCLDEMCDCPEYEWPGRPIKYDSRYDILYIHPHIFGEPYIENWAEYRKEREAVILYGYYGPKGTDIQLKTHFPVFMQVGSIKILGVDSAGSILVKTKNGYFTVPLRRMVGDSEPEYVGKGCKELNKYALENFGLISDENVRIGIP